MVEKSAYLQYISLELMSTLTSGATDLVRIQRAIILYGFWNHIAIPDGGVTFSIRVRVMAYRPLVDYGISEFRF